VRSDPADGGARIFLDSPLAISTTRVFAPHPGFFDDEGKAIFAATPKPFAERIGRDLALHPRIPRLGETRNV